MTESSNRSFPFLLAGVVVLIAVLGAATWKLTDLRRELNGRPPGVSYRAITDLLETPVPDSTGRTHTLERQPWDYLVLFVFSPHDCPTCFDELIDLRDLDEQVPGLAVYGLIGYASADEAGQTRTSYHLGFPVLVDPEGEWIERLNPPDRPWKILFRRHDQRILLEDPRSISAAEREAFVQRVRAVIGA